MVSMNYFRLLLKAKIRRLHTLRYTLVVLAIIFSVLVFGVGIAVSVGAVQVPLAQVWTAIIDPHAEAAFIVRNYRLPRALGAALAGASLAVAGVLLQTALSNSLASPDVVGITKGAGFGAVLGILVLPATFSWLMPVMVIGGAILAAVVLMLTASTQRGDAGIALTGLAVGALFHAATAFLLVKTPGDTNQAMVWLAGSMYGTTMSEVIGLSIGMLFLFPTIIYCGALLDIMRLNEQSILGLGRQPRKIRTFMISVAVLLSAGAVAVAGGISFLGLLAPHIASGMVGQRPGRLLPAAGLVGALLLLSADVVGRVFTVPSEIPAGIVTAVLGAPYLLYLLWRKQRVS
ncbi:FecCD family ABC transporter permease [Corynebacterium kutscheri]|uniref:Iron ABC transporter permease n=1 Tax=Corynebacterium kutscheri TaxID=35755 RepID=A0AB38VVF5_9CORY|nr:iron ABC transporter permease [Corynebacterium kutscheri]VEH08909.1 Iron ABC transporter permease [Corynebacterium kutscheri]